MRQNKSWWSPLSSLSPIPLNSRSSSRRTKKKFEQLKCAPITAGSRASSRTCYDKKILLKIRRAYNQHQTDPRKRISTKNPTEVVDALRTHLADTCTEEECWLNLLPYEEKHYLSKNVFAPNHPKEWLKNPREWLSNYDILEVLQQYEEAYPEFEFLGPSPIDFDQRLPGKPGCVWNEICRFQLSHYLEKGTKKIGISFNLDEHDEAGSHWVTLYIDLEKHLIFYLDSAYNDLPPEIERWVDRVVEQGRRLKMNLTFQKNHIQHQFSNTECGMYSLFFLVTLVTGKWGGNGKRIGVRKALNNFAAVRIPDSVVSQFRQQYFNGPDAQGESVHV